MKAKEFDKKIKQSIRKVEGKMPSGSQWTMDRSWDSIAKLLRNASPKSIAWYFSLAASMSLVMANTIYLESSWLDHQADDLKSTKSVLTEKVANSSDSYEIEHLATAPHHSLSRVKSKHVQPIEVVISTPSPDLGASHHPIAEQSKNKTLMVVPRIGAAFNTQFTGVAGELMVVISKQSELPSIGLSIEARTGFQRPNSTEMGTTKNAHALYVNIVALKSKEHRSWMAKMGIPILHSDVESQAKPILKVNYQRKVGKHLHLGPELIFAKGFQKVYPGFTLSFG